MRPLVILTYGLSLFCCASGEGTDLAKDLRAITAQCAYKDAHGACSKFAMHQLATCGHGDLTCQHAKLVETQQFCNDICSENSLSTMILPPETTLLKRNTQETGRITATNNSAARVTSPKIVGHIQLARNFSSIVEECLRSALNELGKEAQQGTDSGNAKRAAPTSNGIGRDLKLHFMDSQTGNLFVVTPGDDNEFYVEPEDPSRDYYGAYYDDYRYSNLEHPPSYHPVPAELPAEAHNIGYDKEADRNIDAVRYFTLYQDAPAPQATAFCSEIASSTTSPEQPAVTANVLSRLRQKLSINAVQTANKTQDAPVANTTVLTNGARSCTIHVDFITFIIVLLIITFI